MVSENLSVFIKIFIEQFLIINIVYIIMQERQFTFKYVDILLSSKLRFFS